MKKPTALLAAVLTVLLVGQCQVVSAATTRTKIGAGMVAAMSDEQDIFLEAPPQKGEGLIAFARRLTGDDGAAGKVTKLNGKRPRRLLAGVRYRVPYEALSDRYKLAVMHALFPSDRSLATGWQHTVASNRGPVGLWRLARWFTGDGKNFIAIREHNDLSDEALEPGAKVLIPAQLLLPAFRAALPPAQVAQVTHDLEYLRGDDGDFALYRLKKGEALYSAVVVRFTGGTFAEDVNSLAAELAKLNGITDVTDMPVGQRVRIPFDLLLPEYLPTDDPRRVEYETDRSERDKHSNTVRASSLDGITVILDAGHGGHDPGTMLAGTWESVYVYDIMLRIKQLLETTTAATVVPTTRDGTMFRIQDRDVLQRSRGHRVLTSPPYTIADAKVAANLRWYLANSQHKAAVRRSGDDAKTVFLSIHADSLPRTHRGAMIYIPAASLTRGEYGKTGAVYSSRKEVKEKPRVSYSWKERTRSEGLSRQLAGRLLASFRRKGLAIHHEKPIRDRIIRCRGCRPWVPAVVRYNAVPAKLLLEVSNLNNPQDRKLIQTRAFRQRVAQAVVDGILSYYGQSPGTTANVAAR
ncbi:MAG: N-acetylmuramoyl-L-alanine amidase [bacterium]|nr:N-acetylmuramoyl-L-alanine amidase [bacterium]